MGPLPGAIVRDRLAFQIADLHVVEERLLEIGDVAAVEDAVGRLRRPGEAGVDAEVDPKLPQLVAQPGRLVPSLVGEGHRNRRIAVDAALDVEGGMGVPGEDEQAQPERQVIGALL